MYVFDMYSLYATTLEQKAFFLDKNVTSSLSVVKMT